MLHFRFAWAEIYEYNVKCVVGYLGADIAIVRLRSSDCSFDGLHTVIFVSWCENHQQWSLNET